MTPAVCTCGPGVWTACDRCGSSAVCTHECGFPCDDVTCENGTVCWGCLGRPCPVHNDDEYDDEEDDRG